MIDRQSPTWLALEKRLGERIEHLRNTLEAQHDEIATAGIRARISELRTLLQLGTNTRVQSNPEMASPDY